MRRNRPHAARGFMGCGYSDRAGAHKGHDPPGYLQAAWAAWTGSGGGCEVRGWIGR